jgi:RNA polymerase sigma-70 factor (ECF subfamily)
MAPSSDKNIDEKARTNAFLRLLGKHERELQLYVLAMVPNWSDADDIVQEVRIKLWNEFDRYDPDKSFGAWARTLAHYEILAARKKSRRLHAKLGDNVIELIVAEASMRSADGGEDRQSALEYCLAKIDEVRRAILMRYYGGGETLADLAASVDKTPTATKQLVYRVRRTLAECIDRKLGRDEESWIS